ncbi:MAG: hypothetical protein IJX27_01045 [Clostridia bacterium]|nr:hypothetical protein [Clostridia bacterium]
MKITNDSKFYTLAYDAMKKEAERLEAFCENLDKNPELKNAQIAEYKCAKYRYAGVSVLHSVFFNNQQCRKIHDLGYSNYLLQYFSEALKSREDYFALYCSAPEGEKPDYALYYGILAFAEKQMAELEEKMPRANDWERIELTERLGGWCFGAECLHEAWEKRCE